MHGLQQGRAQIYACPQRQGILRCLLQAALHPRYLSQMPEFQTRPQVRQIIDMRRLLLVAALHPMPARRTGGGFADGDRAGLQLVCAAF